MSNCETRFYYDVDVVFCIDATTSMSPLLDMVRRHTLNFYDDLVRVVEKYCMYKRLDSIRIRVIAFRDYLADGVNAMLTTDFLRYRIKQRISRYVLTALEQIEEEMS